ncbi:MAG: hypothetical protein ACLU0O_12115 [Collinsella sp.]
MSGKSDGKITGLDAKMEWRAKGSGEYQGVSDGVTEITDCAVGTYEVRYRADSDHDASSATEVTVNAGGKFVVTLPAKQVGYTITASPDGLTGTVQPPSRSASRAATLLTTTPTPSRSTMPL